MECESETRAGARWGADAFVRAQLRRALEQRRLLVVYQPIVRLGDEVVVGHEALARMRTAAGTVLDAAAFIDAAAAVGHEPCIDADVTAQIMSRACLGAGAGAHGKLFMNCSPAFLADPSRIDGLLRQHREWTAAVSPASVREVPWVVEITERNLDADPRRLAAGLSRLAECGFQFALDDFGSNHSAIPYLLNLPLHYLKFDLGLVAAAAIDPRARRTLGHLQNLAADLDLTTVAEGVEDLSTVHCLRDLGIDLGQGYWWAQPGPGFAPKQR